MPELNTNGLPDWAARLLLKNADTVAKCRESGITYTLSIAPELGVPRGIRGVRVTSLTDNGTLRLTALFGDDGDRFREQRWTKWPDSQYWESNQPILPEIQMDAGIPMGEMWLVSNDPQNSIIITGMETDAQRQSARQERLKYVGEMLAQNTQDMQSMQNMQNNAYQSGLANYGSTYGRELRGDGWLGPSMGDYMNAVSQKAGDGAFAQPAARPKKPAAPEPPEIKSPNGRLIILKNPEDDD